MSCAVDMTILGLPRAIGQLAGLISVAASAAAASCGLRLDETLAGRDAAGNSVELCLSNADEVTSGLSVGKSTAFRGDGVTVVFHQDEEGNSAVRVSGEKSVEELRAIGENFAKRVVQQYAYHRVVTEMRSRHMNIVEEEVEEDGTVRMLVRVRQG